MHPPNFCRRSPSFWSASSCSPSASTRKHRGSTTGIWSWTTKRPSSSSSRSTKDILSVKRNTALTMDTQRWMSRKSSSWTNTPLALRIQLKTRTMSLIWSTATSTLRLTGTQISRQPFMSTFQVSSHRSISNEMTFNSYLSLLAELLKKIRSNPADFNLDILILQVF